MEKIQFKESAIIAIPITIALAIVSWIFGLFGQAVTPLFSSFPAVSVVTGTVGQKIMAWIGGVIPFLDLANIGIPVTYVSAIIAVMLGSFMVAQFKLPVAKKILGLNARTGRLFSIILYGAIIPYLVLIGLVAPQNPLMTGIGIGIHTLAVSYIAVRIADFIKIKI